MFVQVIRSFQSRRMNDYRTHELCMNMNADRHLYCRYDLRFVCRLSLVQYINNCKIAKWAHAWTRLAFWSYCYRRSVHSMSESRGGLKFFSPMMKLHRHGNYYFTRQAVNQIMGKVSIPITIAHCRVPDATVDWLCYFWLLMFIHGKYMLIPYISFFFKLETSSLVVGHWSNMENAV